MTVKPLGNGRYTGLSTDTKPTAANTAVNAIFEETDTSKRYYNSGSAWLPVLARGAYNQIVFKDGSTYYATDSNGKVLSSSTVLETVLQYCLNQGGKTFIADGVYDFSASFAGLDFKPEPTHATISGGSSTELRVPNGYTGYVFRFVNAITATCTENVLESLRLFEAGAVQKLWTGIRLQGTGGTNGIGVSANKIRDVSIRYCKYGIHFLVDATGVNNWCNTNYFQDIWMEGAEVFINFEMQLASTASNGFHRNRFINITNQCTSRSLRLMESKTSAIKIIFSSVYTAPILQVHR